MKGMSMESAWRTVQLFISSQAAGIFEVEVDTKTKRLDATVPCGERLSRASTSLL